jgi:murein tripeptide amidase MpaA
LQAPEIDVFISSAFDAGNIRVLTLDDPLNIRLEIQADNQSDFFQWFHFCLGGARGKACRLHIVNAAGAAYPGGFDNYRVLYSYDRQTWRRHATSLQDGVLSWEFTPAHDAVYFAYFHPYSMERHHDLIARAQCSPRVRHTRLGETLDGQDLDLLTIATPNGGGTGKKSCWFIARQHPGETMAQWWMEGLLECLLDEADPVATALLQQCDIHVVPNMNPDGSRRGHLRTNAAGRNLNREWQTPTLEASPEVWLVKAHMATTGVDFFMDVHGDETLPYNFIAGTEGLAEWSGADQARLDFYKSTLARRNPDFQTEQGYPPKQPGEANMGMSTSTVARDFGCLAMTLEMPFKDTTATPDPEFGWSPPRCKQLARDCLATLQDCLLSGLW